MLCLFELLGASLLNLECLDTLWASIGYLSQMLCPFEFVGASLFNLESLDTLKASTRHPSQKLWPFEFARCFVVEFQASRYIMSFNRTFESNVIAI